MTLPFPPPKTPDHGCRHTISIRILYMLGGLFVSLIIIVNDADDKETQMLTKSPGIRSFAEKW